MHNTLYKKTLEFMSKKLYKDSEKLSVECAKCHNPRISVKKVNKNFLLSKAFGVENKEVKNVKEALSKDYLKEGINCIVCHNVDKINHSKDLLKRGFDAVEWGSNDVMVGPFDSSRTNYHKSVKRDHFNQDINRLCFVCHYGGENSHKLPVYTTGTEYEMSKSGKKCADCHMSERREGIIAPHIKKEGELTKVRGLRSHLFAGVRNSDIAKDAFDSNLSKRGSNLIVTLKNRTPHKVPTGYGGRALRVEVIFQEGQKDLDVIHKDLDALYSDERGALTVPYLAYTIEHDLRLNPSETREVVFDIPKNATDAKVVIWYQLINDKLRDLLDITDPIFTKAYQISSQNIKLKEQP
jgi:nitrate/TMAO reductase-like tetraheme cytochrome c subunit